MLHAALHAVGCCASSCRVLHAVGCCMLRCAARFAAQGAHFEVLHTVLHTIWPGTPCASPPHAAYMASHTIWCRQPQGSAPTKAPHPELCPLSGSVPYIQHHSLWGSKPHLAYSHTTLYPIQFAPIQPHILYSPISHTSPYPIQPHSQYSLCPYSPISHTPCAHTAPYPIQPCFPYSPIVHTALFPIEPHIP